MFRIIRNLAFFTAPLLAGGLSYAAPAPSLQVTSSDIAEGKAMSMEQVFAGFGCTGQNVSPQLSWSGAPAATKSFAVTAYDPDAPTGSGWWHWAVVDIPANVTTLPKGWSKAGGSGARQTRTDFGTGGYGGPCPPPGHGIHHYVFTIYALDIDKMEVPNDASGALVGYNIGAHTLAKGSITAQFSR